MEVSDIINGGFEFGLSFFLLKSIQQVLKDKQVKGIWWPMVAFTTSWGYWNLYYYPNLDQWWSFAGGITVVTCNTIWLALLYKYRNN